MDHEQNRLNLCGCYVTLPTMFRDDDLELNLPAMKRHIDFLVDGGIRTGTGVLLVTGAAGDFQTMTFDERVKTSEAVIEAADRRKPARQPGGGPRIQPRGSAGPGILPEHSSEADPGSDGRASAGVTATTVPGRTA